MVLVRYLTFKASPMSLSGAAVHVHEAGASGPHRSSQRSEHPLTVTLSHRESFPAQLVGAYPITYLAAIRIAASGLTPAKLGHASALQVGEDVIDIGRLLDTDLQTLSWTSSRPTPPSIRATAADRS